MKSIDRSIKSSILRVARRMDEKGLVNAFEGNISVLKDGLLYITPSGQNKAWLTEEMIAVVDAETKQQVDGTHRYSSEIALHMAVYGKRAPGEIGSVVHSHATYLTAFAVTGSDFVFEAYSEFIMAYGGRIPCVPYGTPGTDRIHEAISDEFLGSNIILLGNHGPVSVGKTVEQALAVMEAAEHSAEVYCRALALGKLQEISQDEQVPLIDFFKTKMIP